VTDADGGVTRYTYVDDTEFPATAACQNVLGGDRIKTIQRPGKTAVQTLFYGPGRRVLREVLEDGTENRFSYKVVGACVTNVADPTVKCTANCPDTDSWDNFQTGWRISGGTIVSAAFTDGRGNTVSQRISSTSSPKEVVDPQGQRTQYIRDAQNRIIRRIDPLGRTWQYKYDDKNNVIETIDPLNRIVDKTYDAKWNKVTSITHYLEDGTPVVYQFAYDPNTGNLISTTDPLANATINTFTVQGQLATVTVSGNRTTTYGYNIAGDLVSVIDPLGNQIQFNTDAVGRRILKTDAAGFDTQTVYTQINMKSQVTDAMLGITRFTYTPSRNLQSVINPLNNTIEAYQYDVLDRLTSKTDASGKAETYQYDATGNLRVLTDRKGQATIFTWDERDRLVNIDYPDGTSQARTYDAVGRVTEIREPSSVISYAYDAANRVVKVATDTSAGHYDVNYSYDALDRLVMRTVNGGDATTYAYDKASRPTSITYRGQTITYAWDNANRLVSKTLPDGIVETFTYDDADRMTLMQYAKADGTPIESVAYTYDAKGERISKATSAGTSASETGINATYDAANRLATLMLTATGQTFVLGYDGNGNLVSKTDQANPANVTTYTWDSRNRLSGITAPGITAVFQYDALGHRSSKTVNGHTISYVYDGAQVIGEIAGGTIDPTILSSLAVDDAVARYGTQGTLTYLTDALGSVLALAKDDQSLQAFYAYTPYGESQVLGDDQGNSIQYTGRENDQTGLYFYRARYYDPALKRFISEDPIGLIAGNNVYAYVNGSPADARDPYGFQRAPVRPPIRTPGMTPEGRIDNGAIENLPDPAREWPGILVPPPLPCVPNTSQAPTCYWKCPPPNMCTPDWSDFPGAPCPGGRRVCETGPFVGPIPPKGSGGPICTWNYD
jgi:RHS repeat-associated protein